MALAAGLAWAYGSLRVYDSAATGALEQAAVFFLAGTLVSLAVLLLPFEGRLPPPTLGGVEATTFGILALGALLYLPTMIIIIWGAGRLSPGRVGLLLMLEIVVGVASAAWLTDEPFGLREIAGTVLILAAGAVEVLGRRR
jgi:drug/metabolite transporter (DMT)-like permease